MEPPDTGGREEKQKDEHSIYNVSIYNITGKLYSITRHVKIALTFLQIIYEK